MCLLAYWLRWGLTMWPSLVSNSSSSCHSRNVLGLQECATTASSASFQQQTFPTCPSLLLSFPSPTRPSPCLNLKSKHQTTAPYPSHSACLLSDHSHGEQVDVTVSAGGKVPQYKICPLHRTTLSLIGPGPCGAGAQAVRHIYFLLNNEPPSQG